jgi:two-component system, sensor histidine kinase and response regulator
MSTPNPSSPDAKRAVVIDDDEVMLLSCREVLGRAGYQVETFDNGKDGIARIRESAPPLLVVDLKMPGIDGFEVIRQVRELAPSVVIVVMTGYATIATAVDAMKAGAYDFIPKPFTPSELRLIIDRAFERWRLARESERLRIEKAAAERRFITFVSHQLKSPLAAVRQYLDVLLYTQQDGLSEKAAEWIRRSHSRIGEMIAIIDDWLALARIERGALSETDASSDLATVVEQAVGAHRQQADDAGVTIKSTLPAGLPPVRGDGVSISMVVTNLVNNAIKYNRKGGTIALRAALEPATVRLEVEDSGIGIPTELLPSLFKEFWRAKTPATAGIPGTGLGLAICKRVLTELGGTIVPKSEEGKGTTFVVEFPIAPKRTGTEAKA